MSRTPKAERWPRTLKLLPGIQRVGTIAVRPDGHGAFIASWDSKVVDPHPGAHEVYIYDVNVMSAASILKWTGVDLSAPKEPTP